MAMLWDVFCRVVDFHGDAGVCWRFAAELAARGASVRLWIDDAAALAWMAPGGAPGVEVHPWDEAGRAPPEPGDVVVEAFGCNPPEAFVRRMQRAPAPAWIDLEYLSAEPYVERSHGLPSPQLAGAGAGLTKRFWFPGFTPATGGLLREPGLLEARAAFDRDAWLAARGWPRRAGERVVSVFGYDGAPLPALVERLAEDAPVLLLAAPGAAAQALAAGPARPRLRSVALPWLSQADYDRVLWSADLNAVRGEDSFVRAQWAGAPFVWQIYAQPDGAHVVKLDAFLGRFLEGAPAALAEGVRGVFRAWNGLGAWPARLPDLDAWRAHALGWRDQLATQDDLTGGLLAFLKTTPKLQ